VYTDLSDILYLQQQLQQQEAQETSRSLVELNLSTQDDNGPAGTLVSLIH
jgi:hypothetical protein